MTLSMPDLPEPMPGDNDGKPLPPSDRCEVCGHNPGIPECNSGFIGRSVCPRYSDKLLLLEVPNCFPLRYRGAALELPSIMAKVFPKRGDFEVFRAAYEKARRWAKSKEHRNLLLCGRVGCGKTHLAVAAAMDWATHHQKLPVFKGWGDVVIQLRSAVSEGTSTHRIIARLQRAPLLILDDMGKNTDTDAAWQWLFDIVDGRYQEGLPTIVTWNPPDGRKASMTEVAETTKASIVDRLKENAVKIMPSDWPDVSLRQALNLDDGILEVGP